MINGWPRAAFRPDPQLVPGPERFLGRQRHGGAPRGGVPVLRGTPTPRKRGVAPYQRDIKGKYASRRSAGPLIFGPRDQADATRMQRKARTRTQDCGAGTKKRRLFDIVNENDASGGSGRGVQSRRRQRTRTKAEGAPSCVLRTNDRRASAGVDVAPGPTRARGQPTAVQVPSGLRQALPRATCGLPSI